MVELRLAWRSIWQVRYQSKYALFLLWLPLFGCWEQSKEKNPIFMDILVSIFSFLSLSFQEKIRSVRRGGRKGWKSGSNHSICGLARFFFFFLSSCFSFSPRLHCFAASARSRRPSIDGYNFSISYKTSVFVRSWLSLPPLSLSLLFSWLSNLLEKPMSLMTSVSSLLIKGSCSTTLATPHLCLHTLLKPSLLMLRRPRPAVGVQSVPASSSSANSPLPIPTKLGITNIS